MQELSGASRLVVICLYSTIDFPALIHSSWPLFSLEMGRWLLKIGQLRVNAWVQKEGCRG